MKQGSGVISGSTVNVRLAPDVHDALRAAAYNEHQPIVSIVDRVLRASEDIRRYMTLEGTAS